MRIVPRSAILTAAFAALASSAFAQPPAKQLLDPANGPSGQGFGRSVAATRHATARVDPQALAAERIEVTLFEDVRVTARRTSRSHPRTGSTVWHGRLEAPETGEVTLALVDGALAGSITMDGRMFEIGYAGNGVHEVRELNPALFPTEDPPYEPFDLASTDSSSTSTSTIADAAGQIDVMVVWTPAARNAAGGTTAAIQSVVDLAVANANASYSHSQIATSLRLVYSGEVSFTETSSSISTDLSRLAGQSDGYIDQVHGLRDQYGADVVTMLGGTYANAGYCGVGYLMSNVSTSFAPNAFNVVDQACAGGYLSFAHEVGHNQGLHHDPANAGLSAPSYPYAYGYLSPYGTFRTVMAYGAATRIQNFSNPNVFYSGQPTGTGSQDNALALNNNAATVANFRAATTGGGCTYGVTPTSMSFSADGGSAVASISTSLGCAWSVVNTASWVSVGPGGTGTGSVTITVATNTGGARSADVIVAGTAVRVSQQGRTKGNRKK